MNDLPNRPAREKLVNNIAADPAGRLSVRVFTVQESTQMSQAYVTRQPMTLEQFSSEAADNDFTFAQGSVWETECADGQIHVETFKPPSFIEEWVFEGDGEYGVFCGLYDE